MVDFSRAEKAKNHRSSFLKASDNVIEYMTTLQNEYKALWEENEKVRKERAAIIEETIQLLKNNKIKLEKQLGRCNNSEINEELLAAINSLVDDEKEHIQINLIKINNRYEKISKLGEELEKLASTLANYRVLEDDYEDEVVISVPKKEEKVEKQEKEVKAETPQESPTLEKDGKEKVVNIKTASAELKDSLNETIAGMREEKKEAEPKAKEEPIDFTDDIRYFSEEDLFDTDELSSIHDEVEAITNDIKESEPASEDLEDGEFVLFTIDENLTLKEIAQNVYQNADNWIYLYNYKNNKQKIDRKIAELSTDVETVVSTPGMLENVTLQFPTVLVASKAVEEPRRRVA